MKKIYILTIAILILVSLVAEVLYLAHANIAASESLIAEEMKREITKIEEENQILASEVLSYSSLQLISSKAAEMGFIKPKEFISLKKKSIALKHE